MSLISVPVLRHWSRYFRRIVNTREFWNNTGLMLWSFASETRMETFDSSTFTITRFPLLCFYEQILYSQFPSYHRAVQSLVVFLTIQSSTIHSDSIRHKSKKNLKPNFIGSGIYLSICSMFWCEIIQSLSLTAVQLFCPLNSWFIAA